MSELQRFPLVTVIMIITTALFIFMYMVTSHVFFYQDDSFKSMLERQANQSMVSDYYRNNFLNLSAQQKEFFQYGMVTSVILCPICAYFDIRAGRNREPDK